MEISAPDNHLYRSAACPRRTGGRNQHHLGTQIADTSRCFLLREWHPAQKIIRLEYPGGAVNVGIDSTDETKLLEALKNAGMRTV